MSLPDNYKKFEDKWKTWMECLSGNDMHSVMNQLQIFAWDAAVFEMIMKARLIAMGTVDGPIQFNGSMHRLLDKCFFESKMIAIRRLVEDRWGISGKKGVYSLGGLLKDMKEHAYLLTREHIFKVMGYQYEIGDGNHYLINGDENKYKAHRLNQFFSDSRHENLDRLSYVNAAIRSPKDHIQEEILEFLLNRISTTSKYIGKVVDKRLAHAATPWSRNEADVDNAQVTLKHLWDALHKIYEVANFVSIYILDGINHGLLPISQFDQFQHIERALVDTSDVPLLKKVWQDFELETQKWRNWGLDELEKKMGGSPSR